MTFKKQVVPKVFRAIQNVDIDELANCTEQEIRPILPCLVRMSLISPLDTSKKCSKQKMDILTIISGIELVNSIVALLSIDFHVLEADVKKEQQLRQKIGTTQNDSILIGSLPNGLALEYERSDMTRRLRLVLSELLFIQSQIQDINEVYTEQDFFLKSSELFDNDIYIEEISDVICIALSELPTLLNVATITETLLHVHNGPAIICRVVANFPDSFREGLSVGVLIFVFHVVLYHSLHQFDSTRRETGGKPVQLGKIVGDFYAVQNESVASVDGAKQMRRTVPNARFGDHALARHQHQGFHGIGGYGGFCFGVALGERSDDS